MFLLNKFKKQQAKRTRRKIIFFTLLSSVLSALFAIFFSQEKNREAVTQGAKQASKKVQEISQQASTKIQEEAPKLREGLIGATKKIRDAVNSRIVIKKTDSEE